MPVISSKFKPTSVFFRNSHINTIYASLLRFIPRVKFFRERLELSDGDFLDLDWVRERNRRLLITLGGLEGKSNSLYSRAAIRYFTQRQYDALGVNYRGCSGEPNRLLRGYDMGASCDVRHVVNHVLDAYDYDEIVIIGYSLGGNIAMKYAGEEGDRISKKIRAVVGYSVPIQIGKSEERMNRWYNWHYLKWFMFPLNRKANRKKRQFPDALKTYRGFFMSGNFVYFDTHFNAPANGYGSAEEYWESSSCGPVLADIKVPALIMASLDDTFISQECLPRSAAESNPNLVLEISQYGGHCGFISRFTEKSSWMEERAYSFAQGDKDQSNETKKS